MRLCPTFGDTTATPTITGHPLRIKKQTIEKLFSQFFFTFLVFKLLVHPFHLFHTNLGKSWDTRFTRYYSLLNGEIAQPYSLLRSFLIKTNDFFTMSACFKRIISVFKVFYKCKRSRKKNRKRWDFVPLSMTPLAPPPVQDIFN